jgi:hypothetical protein
VSASRQLSVRTAVGLAISLTAAAQSTDIEERLKRLEAENAEFRRQMGVLAEEQERMSLGDVFTPIGDRVSGLAPAASKIYAVDQGLSIGGYGEALYTDFDSSADDGSPSGRTDSADFLRLVTYVGYKFDQTWLFNSEIEYEHASTGSGGEVSVEFAYLDGMFHDAANLRVGMVLVPMGFINELHEPVTFWSVNRPQVERVLLPTTWRENGFGWWGSAGDFSYRAYLVNGFDAEGFSASGVRGGRQKGAQALAEDFAAVARLDWQGVDGLTLGAAAYVGNSGQGQVGVDVATQILETHLDWRWRGLGVRALLVDTDIDDVAALNNALGFVGADSIGERQRGGYVEVGYDLASAGLLSGVQALTPFVRAERYDTQARTPSGFASDPANDVEVMTFGVAYQPNPQVVFKFDYSNYDNDAGTGVDQFNVGMGFVF